MNHVNTFLSAMHHHLANAGYQVVLEVGQLYFAPLHLTIQATFQYEQKNAELISVCFAYLALNPDKAPEGIQELAFGSASTLEEAIEQAAFQWVNNDFLVIHAFLCPSQSDPGVNRVEMVSQDNETGQQYGWNVLMGPLQLMGAESGAFTEANLMDLFQELMNPVTAYLYQPQLLWVKCFIARHADGNVDGDCRLNYENWLEGLNALYYFAEKWDKTEEFQSRKQFMIIYPRQLEEIQSKETLTDHLNEYNATFQEPKLAKPWWKLW